MRFKKKDIFITKQLSEADIKITLLPKLNDIQSKTNYTVKYFLNIIDIFRRKYYVLVDDETKNSYGLSDNLVDLSYLDSGLDNKITKVKNNLESKIANQDIKIDSAISKINSSIQNVDKFKDVIDSLKVKSTVFEAKMTQTEASIETVKNNIDSLRAKSTAFESDLTLAKSEIVNLKSDLASAKTTIDTLKIRLEALEKKVNG